MSSSCHHRVIIVSGLVIDDRFMFCQECGRPIRETARFCNKCGATVQQQFSVEAIQPPPAPPVNAQPAVLSPPDVHSLAEAPDIDSDEAPMIIPVSVAEQTRAIRKAKHTVFEPPPPKLSPKDATLPSPPPERATSRANSAGIAGHHPSSSPVSFSADASGNQPFFTRAMPAIVNQRHNRLVIVAALLLLTFVVVLILFYLTAKYA